MIVNIDLDKVRKELENRKEWEEKHIEQGRAQNGVTSEHEIIARCYELLGEHDLANKYFLELSNKWWNARKDGPPPHLRMRDIIFEYNHYGKLYLKVGKKKKAKACFKTVLNFWKENLPYEKGEMGLYKGNLDLAIAYFWQKDYAKSLTHSERAEENIPNTIAKKLLLLCKGYLDKDISKIEDALWGLNNICKKERIPVYASFVDVWDFYFAGENMLKDMQCVPSRRIGEAKDY